jgi:hypothetical protein
MMAKIETVKLESLKPDQKNANKGTQRGTAQLEKSLAEDGAGRSILLDSEGGIIAGNKTWEQAGALGFQDVVVVHTTGQELVAVQRDDVKPDDAKRKLMAIRDNRISELNLDWEPSVLAEIGKELDLTGMWTEKELDSLGAPFVPEGLPELPEDELELGRQDVPDALFPTDNDWGVPLLDLAVQATSVDLPVCVWGASGRKARMNGTWVFYTEDYRYMALWADPSPVVNTRCANAVEPNFSCYSQMPRAVGLWRIYMKRWLARWWQSCGVKVFADLNVAPEFYDLNLLGIPHGWKAWATRGYTERMNYTEQEYDMACERAGTSSITFLVYGGGKQVSEMCRNHGWVWIEEQQMNATRKG